MVGFTPVGFDQGFRSRDGTFHIHYFGLITLTDEGARVEALMASRISGTLATFISLAIGVSLSLENGR
jgi:hypothetical protein